jgi:GNAT superfamily N-acetyltransferase
MSGHGGEAVWSMAEFLVRVADVADLEVICDLFRRSSLSNAGDREVLLANPEALAFDGGSIREGRTRVAVDRGRIVGFATTLVGDGVVELEDLFVHPGWMRRGVARALVRDARSEAQAGGSDRIEVTANPHALDFYNAVGFVADGPTSTEFGPGTRMHLEVAP